MGSFFYQKIMKRGRELEKYNVPHHELQKMMNSAVERKESKEREEKKNEKKTKRKLFTLNTDEDKSTKWEQKRTDAGYTTNFNEYRAHFYDDAPWDIQIENFYEKNEREHKEWIEKKIERGLHPCGIIEGILSPLETLGILEWEGTRDQNKERFEEELGFNLEDPQSDEEDESVRLNALKCWTYCRYTDDEERDTDLIDDEAIRAVVTKIDMEYDMGSPLYLNWDKMCPNIKRIKPEDFRF